MPFCPEVVKILAAHTEGPGGGKAIGTGFFLPVDGTLVKQEGLVLTNAHVVTGSPAISVQTEFIEHRPIPVHVVSISHDRDLALLKVNPAHVQLMRRVLKQDFNLDHIPVPAGFADSDSLRQGDAIEAVGYPLGIQQQHTYGVHQGYVQMGEQLRILSGAQINGGNSGGPAFRVSKPAEGAVKMERFDYYSPPNRKVVGINTFKLTGANVGGENGHIAIHDVLQILPSMLNVIDENNELRQKLMQQIMTQLAAHTSAADTSVTAAAAAAVDHLTPSQQENLSENMDSLATGFTEQHLGGSVRGAPRPLGLWMWRHVFAQGSTHMHEGGDVLLAHVAEHAHDLEKIAEARDMGWANMRAEAKAAPQQVVIQLPDAPTRHFYAPTLGLVGKPIFSADMLYHFKCPTDENNKWVAQGGVIMTDVLPGTLFAQAGGKVGQLVHSIKVADRETCPLSPSGSAYYDKREMPLSLINMCHTAKIGDNIQLGVLQQRDGEEAEMLKLNFTYRLPRFEELPEIRKIYPFTDDGAQMMQQKCEVQGIQLTPLRLNHVEMFQLTDFVLPQNRYAFNVVVTNVSPGSPAYHTGAISAGAILTHINEKPVADHWEGVMEQLKKPHQDTGCWVLTTKLRGQSFKFAMKVAQ